MMSVSSLNSSPNAYAYLQSLLQQGAASGGNTADAMDPMSALMADFYPNGANSPSNPAATMTTPAANPDCPQFGPDTMATLISTQAGQSNASDGSQSPVQSLFAQFDGNGDGQISQSEFENAFGPNADTAKVDGLFNALDANGDGGVSLDELTSAVQESQAQHAHHHHHHHMHDADGGGGSQPAGSPQPGGGLADLLSATDVAGATSQTSQNSDGSSTTTITYADGSTVSTTSPAGSSETVQSGGSSSPGGNSNDLLQQLIRLQAQIVAQASAAISSTLAVG
jgi:EF hand domain-containing protein